MILPYALRVNFSKAKGAKLNFSNISKEVNTVYLEIKIKYVNLFQFYFFNVTCCETKCFHVTDSVRTLSAVSRFA